MEREGIVLSGRNGSYCIECGDKRLFCRAASKLCKTNGKLLSGDRVLFSDNDDGSGFVTSLLPRRNSLVRPPVANIDLLAVVVSPKEPEPYYYNIDLLTVIAKQAEIEPLIIVTKCDLFDSSELSEIYRRTPFHIVITSASAGIGISEAKEAIEGRICVLCGASGVGKSSLINAMYPFLDTETGTLSRRIQRGKNTTRVTELFSLGKNTYLADTPGFTAIETEQYCRIEPGELFMLFPEFSQFAGQCRYADCTHTKEKECAVADAAENGLIARQRLESYRKLYYELKSIDRYK